MAKQNINVGTTANDKKGDSLRAAFVKVNANFTELYAALGLTDVTLNLGAFTFTGSVMSTDDSTAITIDKPVTVNGEIVVDGDITPKTNLGASLGTPTKQFKSLYVSGSTIYFNNVPLSLDNSNNILVNGNTISTSIDYTSIPNAPTDVADLTDNTGLLGGGGASTGDITFAATTLTAPNDDEIFIAAKTAERDRAKLRLNPVDGDAYLEVWSYEGTRSDSSWATGVWELNIYGNPTIQFTGAFDLADWVVGTLQSGVDADTVLYSINGGPYIQWNGGSSADPVTGFVDISTGTAPPANPTTITSIDWKYAYKSRIGTSYGNQRVEIDTQGQDLDINIDGSVQLYSTGTMDISNSNSSNSSDINIYSGDDILIQGKNKTTSDSEGGDINIRAGKGGDADSNDSAGGGGDIDIRAGAGGDFSPLYNPGFGGTATLRAGDGGLGSVTYNKIARPGGTLSLYAGSAGYNDGDPSLGSYGANVTIQAGNSNSQSDNGGSIILSPGTNGFGSSTLAGNVEISIPSSSGSAGGSWIFGGDGRTLTIPGDIRSEQAINIDINLSDSTLRRWRFGEDGDLTLPGGGNIDGSDYDVDITASNDGASTFGSVTINTQGLPAVYTVVQQTSPYSPDTITTDIGSTPYIGNIVAGMTVTGSGIVVPTTVSAVTGPDIYGTFSITISPPSGAGLNYNETYTFTSAGGVTNRIWDFNSLGEFYLPQGGAIQETTVTNELWGGTTTSLTLVPGGAGNGTQRLEIYSTGAGEGDHIHITSGDQGVTDLFLGNDTQYFAVAASGANYIQARPGAASPSPGTSAGPGANVNIYAGNAGDNGGNVSDGNSGGDVLIASGISTSGLGGDILLNTSSGPDGFGSIELSTDGGSSVWTFNKDNQLVFPDSTVQTTAYTGPQTTLDGDVTGSVFADDSTVMVDGVSGVLRANVNVSNTWTVTTGDKTWSFIYGDVGEGTTPTLEFPGNLQAAGSQTAIFARTTDLSNNWGMSIDAGNSPYYVDIGELSGSNHWRFSGDGSLTLPGELHGAPVISGGAFPSQVGRTVNITPADDASDKSFKFRIDQYGETFTRAYLEFPTAEVDKQVAAVFPHTNGKAGYIYTQGNDTNGQGMNDAFNIFYNSGDIKITSMGLLGGLYTWKFGDSGDLTVPGSIRSESNINIDINLSDSTLRRWSFGEDGNLNLAGNLQFPNGAEIRDVNGDLRLRAAPGDVAQLQGLTTDGAVDAAVKAFHDIETGSYVTINTNIDAGAPEHIWTFDYNGVLTLPAGGDIQDSTGTSVLGGGGGGSVLEEPFESKTSATGVIEHDATTNRLFRHTSISANFTANFTNLGLAVNEATSISLVLVQGATARMVTAVQIGGAAQTITWQGSASAPLGNANRTDVVTFSILCTATDTYTVLGMLTSFGG